MTELQTDACPDMTGPLQNLASALQDAHSGTSTAISNLKKLRWSLQEKTQIRWVVANKFLTNSNDGNLRKLRKSGYREYGKFEVLSDAWQCRKQHPNACITRCVIDRGHVTFEHWYGRERLAIYIEGKYQP